MLAVADDEYAEKKYSSRLANCSKTPEAKLCLLPASAYALHEFSLGIYCDPSS